MSISEFCVIFNNLIDRLQQNVFLSHEHGDEVMDLGGYFYDAPHTEEDVDDLIVDGKLQGAYLDATIDDLEILEENVTNEKDHWRLREDLVSIQEI